VTGVRAVLVVTTMYGGQRGPDDRVWAVRCHTPTIGKFPATP
jgi:hypothetical protein